MAGTRPKSIFERFTTATTPSPNSSTRFHFVQDREVLISVANDEYALLEYDPDLWRGIALANGVQNPTGFGSDFLGQTIVIPAPPLPEFT